MVRPLLGLIAIFILLIVAEVLRRKGNLKPEWSRKIVHMGVGTFVAFWPFFTSFHWVQLLAVAFLAVICLSRWLHIFRGIHDIKRKSIGEVFYPIGIGLAALLTTNKYIFAAAILHLSLADGLAAVIGIKYGGKHRYRVGKLTKSYLGTATFMAVSAAITYWAFRSPTSFGTMPWGIFIALPLGTALVENIAPYGSDNLFIPLTVIVLLRLVPGL